MKRYDSSLSRRLWGTDTFQNNEYRQLLIHSIHQCAIKFSEVAASVVELLMDFIADFNASSAVDVISFVKEVVEKFPKLRPSIVERLVSTLSEVRAGKVYRGALWSWRNTNIVFGATPAR